ncbi:MAG: FG-GAP repeat protein [Verrucomicrobia bacterium]|nr:FG-GAP repeat protein [Verrucomicrobiota bacterium]
MLIGAPTAQFVGAAYLYDLHSGELLHAFSPTLHFQAVHFGGAVTLHEDWIIVGANNANSGAVYVFSRATGEFAALLEPTEADWLSNFGYSLVCGTHWLAVGAPFQSSIGGGKVHVYSLPGLEKIFELEPMTAPPVEVELRDRFGWALAQSNDRLMIGAPGANNRAGSVRFF